MVNIALLSMFSTSTGYLLRYVGQVSRLQGYLESQDHTLRCIWCEGDSRDETWGQLCAVVDAGELPVDLLQHHHGNFVYASVEHPQRFKQLSRIWNEMLDQVTPDDDVVVIVESDLIWDHRTLAGLIDRTIETGGIYAPMVMQRPDHFRDVWAYRRNGERFTNQPPFHPDLNGKPLQLDSAGSVLVMPAEAARQARTTEAEELVGFCHEARRFGWQIWCDPAAEVRHP